MDSEQRMTALVEARAGNDEALGRLLESFSPYVRVIARALRSGRVQARLDDSDLIQSVFLEAHQHFATFRGTSVSELAAWLRQIAVRTTGRAFRDQATGKRDPAREQPLGEVGPWLVDSGTSPSQRAIKDEQAARGGGFLHRQAGKHAGFDHLGRHRFRDGQALQGFVQLQEPLVGCLRRRFETCQINARHELPAPCRFDQDAAHGLRGRSEEVAPIHELLSAHESQVCFMDQRGGLQRLPRLLVGQLRRGQAAQLIVDQRQELLGSVRVALLNRGEGAGNFIH